jgi:hypothetical protein
MEVQSASKPGFEPGFVTSADALPLFSVGFLCPASFTQGK